MTDRELEDGEGDDGGGGLFCGRDVDAVCWEMGLTSAREKRRRSAGAEESWGVGRREREGRRTGGGHRRRGGAGDGDERQQGHKRVLHRACGFGCREEKKIRGTVGEQLSYRVVRRSVLYI